MRGQMTWPANTKLRRLATPDFYGEERSQVLRLGKGGIDREATSGADSHGALPRLKALLVD